MASLYDQALLDAGGSAPQQSLSTYDQAMLDASPAPKQPKAVTLQDDIKSEMDKKGWLERNYIGAGTALSNLFEGGKQRVDDLMNAGQWYNGHPQPYTNSNLADKQQIQSNRTMADAAPVGSVIGNTLLYSPLALAPGANSVIGGGAYGALTGALQPTLGNESVGMNTLYSTMAGAAIPALATALRMGKSAIEPMYKGGQQNITGRLLNSVAGDETPSVINNLQNAQQLVPGSLPTAGEVAQNGGISALQRAATQSNPTPFTTRVLQQQSARLDALRGIAQSPDELNAAITARESATKPLYDAANNATLPVTPPLQDILSRLPNGAMAYAQDLARQGKTPFLMGNSSPAFKVSSGVLDATGNPIMKDVPAQVQNINGGALSNLEKSLQDTISGSGDTQLGINGKRIATGLRQNILSHMDENIPEYGQARSQYAKLSQPINQMQVGQDLLSKITPALSDFGALGKETAAKYALALRNSLQTVKNATGFEQPLDQLMTPEKMQTLTAVGQDLARRSNAQELGRGVGSNTFQNLSMNNIANQSGSPKIAGGILNTINGVMNHVPLVNMLSPSSIYSGRDKSIQDMISEALLNPNTAAQYMSKAAKPPSVLIKALKTTGQGLMLSATPNMTGL